MKPSLPAPTKAEQRRFEIIKREIGCVACYIDSGVLGTWADAHHLIDPETGNRISHAATIPLCPEKHHKYGRNSIHRGKLRFREDYGTDVKLLDLTNSKVSEFESMTVGGWAVTNRHDTSSGFVVEITPCPKPRMTQRDKWAKRACVMRYWAFAEELNLKMPAGIDLNGYTLTFGLPMPKSWSKKKRLEMDGKPHTNRVDLDNLCKSVFDALYLDDSHIHTIALKKVWAVNGFILFEAEI